MGTLNLIVELKSKRINLNMYISLYLHIINYHIAETGIVICSYAEMGPRKNAFLMP